MHSLIMGIIMFSKEETKLLDASYETLVGRTHLFDIFSGKKWKDTGIENWVQTELIVALVDRGYDVTTIGKRNRDCDVIVKKDQTELDVGIEIKTITHANYFKEILVKQGLEKHCEADLFLFLAKVDERALNKLTEYFRQHNYIEKRKSLNDKWIIMLVKKNPTQGSHDK